MLAAVIGTAFVYFKCYKKLNSRSSSTSFKENLRAMLSYGSPLYISRTLSGILGTYQGMILAWFITNVAIGNFNVATNFSTIILLLTGPISTALFPAFSTLNPSGEEIRGDG
jgi:O-antigen/teichoic acid export membrane protein